MMKDLNHPALFITLLYLGGIVAADSLEQAGIGVAPWPALVALLGIAIAALVLDRARPWCLAIALFAAGIANYSLQTALLSPIDLRRVAPAEPALASVRGRLLETPTHRLYSRHDEVTFRTQAALAVEAIRWRTGPWHAADGTIMVSSGDAIASPFHRGRRVEIDGVLQAPPGPDVPGGFDYRAHLRRRGIHFQLRCDGAADWHALEAVDGATTAPAPVFDRFGEWAKAMLARGLPEEDQPLQLLWAMTLGWRTALTGEVSEPFMRSGTMHVFAISGLHVALIAHLLVALLRVCRLPRAGCAVLVIPLLWAYTSATGWQASAIRSTIMMTVIVAGWLFKRPSDLLNSLAASAFLILLWDPQQLFQAGFQLSFLVVLSLALLGPWLERLRQRLFQFDPWVPDELRPAWQRRLRKPIDYLTTSAAVSLAAWLGSLPLIAGYFNLLTPISLFANLVVVPLSSGALSCALGSLLTGPIVPFLGELFNHCAWFFMLLMIRASEWAAAVPGGSFNVATPGPLLYVVYYGTLTALLAGWFQRPKWGLRCAGALAALGLVLIGRHVHERAQTTLTILPLNGSAAIHLSRPTPEERWLIDCGNESSAAFTLKPYLRRQGVNQIENVLITHGDVHHAGGLPFLRSTFPIYHVWFSAVPFRSTVYRDVQRHMAASKSRIHTAARGQSLPPWTVLHPDSADRQSQADDNALVLLGRFGGTSVLLLSDLGKPGQNLLLSRYPDLRADIVIAGLPNRSEPLADPLLEALRPRLIVVADAVYPASHRAGEKLRERLSRHGIPIIYTRNSGAITLRFRDGGWTVEPPSAARAPE